jgi:hypothetical protein
MNETALIRVRECSLSANPACVAEAGVPETTC